MFKKILLLGSCFVASFGCIAVANMESDILNGPESKNFVTENFDNDRFAQDRFYLEQVNEKLGSLDKTNEVLERGEKSLSSLELKELDVLKNGLKGVLDQEAQDINASNVRGEQLLLSSELVKSAGDNLMGEFNKTDARHKQLAADYENMSNKIDSHVKELQLFVVTEEKNLPLAKHTKTTNASINGPIRVNVADVNVQFLRQKADTLDLKITHLVNNNREMTKGFYAADRFKNLRARFLASPSGK